MRVSDRIFGLFGLALAAFYAWAASWIEDPFIVDPLGPRKFPYIIAIVLSLASLAAILRPDPEPDWPALGPPAGLGSAIAALAVVGYGVPALLGLVGIAPETLTPVAALLLLAAPVVAIPAAQGFGPVSPATEVIVAIVAMIAYALALPELGFLPATAISAAYLGWRLGSGPVSALVAGIVTALTIYIVFHKILGLSLAKGPLGPYVDAIVDPVVYLFARAWEPVQAGIDWLRGLFGGGDAGPAVQTGAGD